MSEPELAVRVRGLVKSYAAVHAVRGYDPGKQRAKLKPVVGIVLQSTGVEPYLTVAETLRMYAGLYPHPRPVEDVITLVGLTEKRDSRVTKLSGGQKRRLDVAVALVGDPELLFLDEPTTGFDPSARREAWQVVKNLAGLGKTVVLTTHFMDPRRPPRKRPGQRQDPVPPAGWPGSPSRRPGGRRPGC
jgi:ABC-type multidrug transport system ATPase subunit